MLNELPDEVLEHIFGFLSYIDIKNCLLLNHDLYSRIFSMNRVWRLICRTENLVIDSDELLDEVQFYREKLFEFDKRRKRLDMKGYGITTDDLQTDLSTVQNVVCNGDLLFVSDYRTLYAYNTQTWVLEFTHTFPSDIQCLAGSSDTLLVIFGHVALVFSLGHEGFTERSILDVSAVENVKNISCIRLYKARIAILHHSVNKLLVFENGKQILETDVLDNEISISLASDSSWRNWDGFNYGIKGGLYDKVMEFVNSENILAVVSPRGINFLNIMPFKEIQKIRDVDCFCSEYKHNYFKKCYFWPGIAICKTYICYRTSCNINIISSTTFQKIRIFQMNYNSVERLISPHDRGNIVGVGSKFLLMIDGHWYPRLVIMDVNTGQVIDIVGDDKNEISCPPISLYKGFGI